MSNKKKSGKGNGDFLKGFEPSSEVKRYLPGSDIPESAYSTNKVKPVFCFEYLAMNATGFCFNNKEVDQSLYHKVLDRLKVMSQKTYEDLKKGNNFFRFHSVDLDSKDVSLNKLDFKKTLTIVPDSLEDKDLPTLYQFDAGHEEARIAGFLGYYGIFYLVWLDKNHKLYPRK